MPLTQEVAAKLTMLKNQGVKVLAAGVRAIAAASREDALVVLQALAKRGSAVADPTQWVLNSLAGRAAVAAGKAPAVGKAPGAKAPLAKVPGAKAPIAKAPAGKAGIAKAPPAGKAPLAKAPVGKAGLVKAPAGKAPVGKAPPAKAMQKKERVPPKPREGLDFEQLAVQVKLQSLNKQQIWPGPHPLDEPALAALLRMNAFRAMEILEEAEEKGTAKSLTDPSAFVRRAVALEEALPPA